MINRHFGIVRDAYSRILARTLGARPAVLAIWAVALLLVPPFYLFSQRELEQ
jgi:hypothetical protein